jgi:O-antigen/teichoic acid export membrane protein
MAADALDTPEAGRAATRGGLLRSAGYVLGVGLGVLSAPLLIRHLGEAEFGRYTTILSIVVVAAGITEGGLNAILLREHATREGAERDRVLANLLGVRLALTLVTMGGAVAFVAIAGYGSTLVVGAALAAAGLLTQVVQTMLATSLQAELRFGWATTLDLVRQVLIVALIVIGVVADADVLAFLAVPLLAGVVPLVLTAWLVRDRFPLRPQLHSGVFWPILRDSLPYGAAIAVNIAYLRVTLVVLSLTATALETGHFAVGFRVMEVLVSVPSLAVAAAFPILARAARDDRNRLNYASDRIFEASAIAGAGLAIVLVVGAEPIVKVLGGTDPAVDALRIQGAAILATFLATSCAFPLLSLHRHAELLWANAAALVTTVVLTVVLAPPLGAEGGAIAMVAAETVLAVSLGAMLARARGHRPPLGSLLGILACAVPPAALVLALGLPGIVAAPLAAVAFAALLLATNRVPSELTDLLPYRRRA